MTIGQKREGDYLVCEHQRQTVSRRRRVGEKQGVGGGNYSWLMKVMCRTHKWARASRISLTKLSQKERAPLHNGPKWPEDITWELIGRRCPAISQLIFYISARNNNNNNKKNATCYWAEIFLSFFLFFFCLTNKRGFIFPQCEVLKRKQILRCGGLSREETGPSFFCCLHLTYREVIWLVDVNEETFFAVGPIFSQEM